MHLKCQSTLLVLASSVGRESCVLQWCGCPACPMSASLLPGEAGLARLQKPGPAMLTKELRPKRLPVVPSWVIDEECQGFAACRIHRSLR